MLPRISALVLTSAAMLCGTCSLAADAPSLGKDLKATIALQGKPCDQLAETKRNGDSDYTASCKDGNRYRIYVDPQGRVIVQKL
jgi:hypothetical protein